VEGVCDDMAIEAGTAVEAGTAAQPGTAARASKAADVAVITDDVREVVDAQVERASLAAEAFRRLDQAAVDRIVDAMVRAGLRAASELAMLAVRESGFGVFEDKVIKNFVATEFLNDYLKDKKTVGVIDCDKENGLEFIAEPVGVIVAVTPITNPTSTVLFKAICAAKTRNTILFRAHPMATRCALRAVEILVAAGEAAGLPAGAIQVVPMPENNVTHYLFRHPDVDFLWTTGGPRIVQLTNEAGKPCLSVGPGNAPCYVHKSADLKGVVVDVLISKTFDASVICPAEQTMIIDHEVYDEVVAEFVRMGAYLMNEQESVALADFVFEGDPAHGGGTKVNMKALGQRAPELARRVGFEVPPHVEYSLTRIGASLAEVVESLDEWVIKNYRTMMNSAASASGPCGAAGVEDYVDEPHIALRMMLKQIRMRPAIGVQHFRPRELKSAFRAPRCGEATKLVFAKRTANGLRDLRPVRCAVWLCGDGHQSCERF